MLKPVNVASIVPDKRVPTIRSRIVSACRMPLRATRNKPTVKGSRKIKIKKSSRIRTAHEVRPNQKSEASKLDGVAFPVPERIKDAIPPKIAI